MYIFFNINTNNINRINSRNNNFNNFIIKFLYFFKFNKALLFFLNKIISRDKKLY